jgi:predicted methyltransferase
MQRPPLALLLLTLLLSPSAAAQEHSVRPGINRPYQDPDVARWVAVFERPGREVYDRRHAIVAATGVSRGMRVADIGAGTGLFTRLFAARVGPQGQVYAVDIADEFIENILRDARARGLDNVQGIVNGPRETGLPAGSLDLAFVCATYHHFEYPEDMLASLRTALRPGGELIVIDFRKMPGRSSRWVMGHVRAGKKTVIREVEAAGFEWVAEQPVLRANYFLRFRRTE